MKSTKIFTLLTVLMCATTTWAQTNVATDKELRDAIADKANIKLTADIVLSNSTLNIAEGMTVTIDLGSHTLDRGLKAREWKTGGQVITVRKDATLNLKNGTLTGGWGGDGGGLLNEAEGTANLTDVIIADCTGDDRGGGISNHGTLTMEGGSITGNTSNDAEDPKGGGGIMNNEGATATLTDVTITGNKVTNYGGGGICNFGTLTIDGCTITGNTAITHGAGIWQEGKVYMQGKVTITGNYCGNGMTDNFYKAKDECVINIIGSLKNSNIGISMPKTGYITNGYTTYHGKLDPKELFSADRSEIMKINLEAEEAHLASSIPENETYYIERSWDNYKGKVVSTLKVTEGAVVLGNSGSITLTKKFYVVKDNITINGNILIKPEDESVGIILCDGAELKTDYSIVFEESTTNAKLHIYGQENNSGKLNMSDNANDNYSVRIGNMYYKGHDTMGEINIHGGNLDVNGKYLSAAIGAFADYHDGGEDQGRTAYYAKSGTINIYDGTIKAYGGTAAAGIGGGYYTENYGTINIYGGTITATGRYSSDMYLTGGAGIGGGQYCYGGNVNIAGGNITAVGADEAAGIGCGEGSDMDYGYDIGPGDINIYGGTVTAQGGKHGAGIGKGDGTSGPCNIMINGGYIKATGGVDAAGIGGGEGGPGGNIDISGGYIEAYGNDYGAGIGGGQDGAGGTIKITGGTIIAKAGRDETGWRAFGPGSGSDDYGSLTVGDILMVSSERMAAAVERHDMCWYRTQARVEPCKHQDATYIISGTTAEDTHTIQCKYCTTPFKAEKHNFVDGKCVVCGTKGTAFDVSIYLPKKGGKDGDYDSPEVYQVAAGAKYTLPVAPDDRTPEGLEFAGWLVAGPEGLDTYVADPSEKLLPSGSTYDVTSNVSFTARYKEAKVILSDNEHNSATIGKYDGKKVSSVTLEGRTFYKTGKWNTLCLPFAVDNLTGTPLEGATLMTLGNSSACSNGFNPETGTLTLDFVPAEAIEPGVAYIVKWETPGSDIKDPVFENVTIENEFPGSHGTTSEDGTVTFYGTYNPKKIYGEDRKTLYMGPENTLYYPKGDMTINAFRSFFRLIGITVGDGPGEVRSFDVNLGEGTTGLNGVKSKVTEERSEVFFDLSGRRVVTPKKGIYIVNGKKVVLK